MLNQLQTTLLEMLKWITGYMDSKGLRYYVIGGTILGAVRHEGFIPWDDDIDIGMPRLDYEKLINYLQTPLDHYIIETIKTGGQEYLYPFAKLYDMNTTLIEKLNKNVKRGVYIDIFPLDGLGKNLEESRRFYKKIDRLNMLLAMKVSTWRKDRKPWKNIATIIGKCIPVNTKKLIVKISELCMGNDYDSSEYVANCVSTYRAREIMEKKIYGKQTKYCFEGISVYGPEKAEIYLKTLYGEWKQLPPPEKRHSAHDFIEVDINKPYI